MTEMSEAPMRENELTDRNLLSLMLARTAAENRSRQTTNPLQSVERFYHLALLELAGCVYPTEFKTAMTRAAERQESGK